MKLTITQKGAPDTFKRLIEAYNIQDTRGKFIVSNTLEYKHNHSNYYLDEIKDIEVRTFEDSLEVLFLTSRASYLIGIDLGALQLFT